MLDKELINKIRQLKERNNYTLYDLSRITDMQVATLSRWLKTGRINRMYAKIIKEKLQIG